MFNSGIYRPLVKLFTPMIIDLMEINIFPFSYFLFFINSSLSHYYIDDDQLKHSHYFVFSKFVLMDHDGDDLEAGIISNIPRNLNKKMRKRKHLDALLKFRSPKTRSNDILRSSEDELFIPHQKPSIPKM